MPKNLRVVPEDLQLSASTIDLRADTVRVAHATADGRIEAAQRGLPAGSAAILSGAVAKWQADSTALFARMVDHSTGLRTGAIEYSAADTDNGAAVDAAGERIPPSIDL
ncbi:type VII secretion target [Mycolicibacterium sediminis]|uniref:ESX-1 secretion-associated protein n=1 Tax=Mycolicibacterium sediminis TaxID=1286180 RepID=A0A7I7QVL8_9MYCO|nr:type VII secretion target [Mycolicibacterium sediminis]BBY29956.1 hypothetical protein MSEDJ_40520 [Mycolicibacterium sediminis]